MEYWKLARWPHWAPGFFALMGIFYARKLFETSYLTISFWFFFPFLLAGIASELLVTAVSLKKNVGLLSETERRLAKHFDWKVIATLATVLFITAAVLSNLYTKGIHSSWYVIAMAAFSLVYGLVLRQIWLVDVLSFPLFYLIPAVAGTLDTMLPLFATQIVLVYMFGVMVYAVRLTSMLEVSTIANKDHSYVMTGGLYDRQLMACLLGLSGAAFALAMAYHLIEQASRLGRISLIIIPLMIYIFTHVTQHYRAYVSGQGEEKNFREVVWNLRVKVCTCIALICLTVAVNWRI
ncbi:V-type ATP synthase subunit I domain-containing protein [Undibacterium umbellatum]|uniref:Prenyltransferase n=1 Tax=Undibacterium umbellatum TaxID=2762300 RepID=A0ABR6ZG99_9BURK|nr:hypothetical protein [Undibacterium umbellatum]MBC3910763.1 hypothetical protein [Undibacterium umbellatum]